MLLLVKAAWYAPEERWVKVPVGVFTQKQFVYKAIAVLEGMTGEDTEPHECIKAGFPDLYLDMARGKQTLNYNRLCFQLKDQDRLAILDREGVVKYVLWVTEMNAMMPMPGTDVVGGVVEEGEAMPLAEGDEDTGVADPVQPNLI